MNNDHILLNTYALHGSIRVLPRFSLSNVLSIYSSLERFIESKTLLTFTRMIFSENHSSHDQLENFRVTFQLQNKFDDSKIIVSSYSDSFSDQTFFINVRTRKFFNAV